MYPLELRHRIVNKGLKIDFFLYILHGITDQCVQLVRLFFKIEGDAGSDFRLRLLRRLNGRIIPFVDGFPQRGGNINDAVPFITGLLRLSFRLPARKNGL